MSNSLLSIGVSGLSVAQMGLATTEHNIANVNTAGYNRQRIGQSSNTPNPTSGGFVGRGVHLDTIRRNYDQFLSDQVSQAQSAVSEMDAYGSQIKQINNMLADASAGLSPALQGFFASVQELSTNPSQTTARQALLSSAQAMASRFHTLDQRLGEMYDSVNGQLTTAVDQINGYTQRIADLNAQIVRASGSLSQPPNDLLDQRDQLINELNKLVKVQVVGDRDGVLDVFVGSGQQLVIGTQAREMSATVSPSDPQRLILGLMNANGSTEVIPEANIGGGSLGGLLRFRSESVDVAANSLGQIAASVILTFNAQHAIGQDLNGGNQTNAAATGFQTGFFDAPFIAPVVANPGNSSATVPGISFATPSGDPAATNYYTNISSSDYTLTVESVTGGSPPYTYTLTRATDGQRWSGLTSASAAVDGLQISDPASGTMAVGDVFSLQPTRQVARNIAVNLAIVGDVSKIAAATPVSASVPTTNLGAMRVSTGTVGTNYSTTMPASMTMTYSSATGNLTLSTARSLRVTYSDGSTITTAPPATTATIAYNNGTAVLAKVAFLDSQGNNAYVTEVTGGRPMQGDVVNIGANTNGVADNRNMAKLANLQTQNTMLNNRSTFQNAYASLVGTIGAIGREVEVTGDAQKALLDQVQGERDSISAVNLDEEAANLIKYQQAYQASAKVLGIASQLFNSILAIGQ